MQFTFLAMDMDESFKPVSAENIPKLLTCLKMHLPKSAMIYNVTQSYLDDRFSENISTKLFAYTDDFDEAHALSLFVFSIQHRKQDKSLPKVITLLAPENPSQQMLTSFEKSISWTSVLGFASVDTKSVDFIKEMSSRNGKIRVADPCFSLAMTIPKALSLSIRSPSDSVVVRELTEDCAEKVTSRWKFSDEGTLEVMRDSISTMGSAGVFVNSELVSWVVLSAYGSMISLYTEDGHRRKGYAELALTFCMKLAGERGLVPTDQVELPNLVGKKLMEKCGLEYSHDVEWIIYEPRVS